MSLDLPFDVLAVRRACQAYGVRQLWVFGSVVSGDFRSDSDVDFLVEFVAGREHPFADYFGLRTQLEQVTGRDVDLVVLSAVRNPYFKASAVESARELYAA